MGVSIDIGGVDDDSCTDLSMSYSSWGKLSDYMEKHGIKEIKIMDNKNDPDYMEYIYTRESLEKLIKIAKKEEVLDEISGLSRIEAILEKSKSKTFQIDYWG